MNQNRHLYVAKAYNANISEESAIGTIGGVKTIGEGLDKELFFQYKGADSTMKSDRIPLKNLNYVKAFKAQDMVQPLKVIEISLDPDVNEGKVIPGQDYILGIEFRQWIGGSDKDTYYKNGAVHATAAMVTNPAKFYEKMVESLNLNFSREIGANKNSNPYLKFEVSGEKIVITEKIQGWNLGTEAQQRVLFSVIPGIIYDGSEDLVWGKVEDKTPAKADAVAGTTGIGNGTKIADLEYFCMGERGDQYRNMGWPNVIPTKYLVDATQEYDVLEFHFAFTDEGVNSYRSEKDITVVSPKGGTVINDLIEAINAKTGLEVAPLN